MCVKNDTVWLILDTGSVIYLTDKNNQWCYDKCVLIPC